MHQSNTRPNPRSRMLREDGMTMKNEQDENESQELYIDELGEVRGGIELPVRLPIPTLGILAAEGGDGRPWNPPGGPKPEPRDPRLPLPLPHPSTDALGEEGPSPWVR
jgi:hypothetical protein